MGKKSVEGETNFTSQPETCELKCPVLNPLLPQPENVQSPLPSPGIAEREAQSTERSPPVGALKVEVGPDNFGTAKSPTLHLLQVLKKVSETRGLESNISAASDTLK